MGLNPARPDLIFRRIFDSVFTRYISGLDPIIQREKVRILDRYSDLIRYFQFAVSRKPDEMTDPARKTDYLIQHAKYFAHSVVLWLLLPIHSTILLISARLSNESTSFWPLSRLCLSI